MKNTGPADKVECTSHNVKQYFYRASFTPKCKCVQNATMVEPKQRIMYELIPWPK